MEKVVATSMDFSVQKSDPTAHAELNLIRQYCQDKNLISLEGYTHLYPAQNPASCVLVPSIGPEFLK
jgi:tRNA(Arg) A34 adenosine deaminase TadA